MGATLRFRHVKIESRFAEHSKSLFLTSGICVPGPHTSLAATSSFAAKSDYIFLTIGDKSKFVAPEDSVSFKPPAAHHHFSNPNEMSSLF